MDDKQKEEIIKKQRRTEFRNGINSEKNKIIDIQNKKNKYKKMRGEIQDAITKLTSAKSYIADSQEALKSTYIRNEPGKDSKIYQEALLGINRVISLYSNTIIPSIENKIKQLNTRMEQSYRRIKDLENSINLL